MSNAYEKVIKMVYIIANHEQYYHKNKDSVLKNIQKINISDSDLFFHINKCQCLVNLYYQYFYSRNNNYFCIFHVPESNQYLIDLNKHFLGYDKLRNYNIYNVYTYFFCIINNRYHKYKNNLIYDIYNEENSIGPYKKNPNSDKILSDINQELLDYCSEKKIDISKYKQKWLTSGWYCYLFIKFYISEDITLINFGNPEMDYNYPKSNFDFQTYYFKKYCNILYI